MADLDTLLVIAPRDVPLGGPRSMTVRRTLPSRETSLVGAWCFADHFGPDDVAASGGMQVARHPHTGLATVSWLFEGAITHLDASGAHALVTPGMVDMMIAGYGITHSEFSTGDCAVLHGLQLWYALPDRARHREREFAIHEPAVLRADGIEMRVGMGRLRAHAADGAVLEDISPLVTDIPLLLAQIDLAPGTALELDLDGGHEHAVLTDRGAPRLELVGREGPGPEGATVEPAHLALIPDGSTRVRLVAGEEPARVAVLGGEPLGEEIVMWWNLIGRSHEEIVAFRARYQAEIGAADAPAVAPIEPGTVRAGLDPETEQFGPWPDGTPRAWSAPPLPGGRLKPRGRRGVGA